MSLKQNGKALANEVPDYVNRFFKLCDDFQAKHGKEGEKGLGNRVRYTIKFATLEVGDSSNCKFRRLTGVGQAQTIYGETMWEINEDLLEKMEKSISEADKKQDVDMSYGI